MKLLNDVLYVVVLLYNRREKVSRRSARRTKLARGRVGRPSVMLETLRGEARAAPPKPDPITPRYRLL